MRLAVIGCGSLGLLLAARLALAGADAVLVCRRPEQVEAINRLGVRVYGGGGEAVARVRAAHASSVQRGGFDVALVAVKAYDTPSAVEVARTLLRRGGLAVSLQNGLGPLEYMVARLSGSYSVHGAAVYLGARRLSDNEVEYAGGSRIVLGPPRGGQVSREAELLAEILGRAGLEVRVVDDIEPWRWDKLAVNAAVNPVTAVFGVPNGALARSRSLMGIAENVAREVKMVADAEGVRMPRDPVDAVRETVERTAGNKSSMLQDVEARRQTEVDYINGAVVRLGLKHGIHTPYNEALYLMVKGLEDLYEVERRDSGDLLAYVWRLAER